MIDLANVIEYARSGIEKHLGEKTDEFLAGISVKLDKYTEKWQLSQVVYMETDTVNLLFSCESAIFGACVLKMCIPGAEVATEINCLRAYNGRGYVKLHDYSRVDDVLLLERVMPGDQMWAVDDYRERARLFAELVKDLPIEWNGQGEFPTYRIWMEKIHKTLTDMGGLDDALFYLNDALRVYDELKVRYNQKCLLHGDLHQENLLLNTGGGYTVIDPKGVVDNPVMEVARFLLNEFGDKAEEAEKKIREMVAIMSPIIGVLEKDIFKAVYVDVALGSCWTLNEYHPTQEKFETAKAEAMVWMKEVWGWLQR